MSRDYEVEVLTQVDAIRSVAEAWDGLADRFGNPLLGANWFLACAETLCSEQDLRVVVVRSPGALHAVAPLVVVRRDGVKRLELLGAAALYEPTGFLYDNIETLHCLVHKIVGLRLPIMLARIDRTEPVERVFKDLARGKGIVIGRKAASAAFIASKGSWQDYVQSISSQRRHDYQRKRKRAEKGGPVAVRIECPHSQTELPSLLDEVFRIEGAGWKGRSGSALRSNVRVRKFMERYSAMACESGTLRACFLDVGGVPIATILGIEKARRFWVLKIGYDERWARCSPGVQLTMETIKYVFEQGLDGYEFLGSEEPWQAMWPHDRRLLISLTMYPISPGGLWAIAADFRRLVLRRSRYVLSTSPSKKRSHGSE